MTTVSLYSLASGVFVLTRIVNCIANFAGGIKGEELSDVVCAVVRYFGMIIYCKVISLLLPVVRVY
jgi:hypothetical protein